jgi:hypothetical protein
MIDEISRASSISPTIRTHQQQSAWYTDGMANSLDEVKLDKTVFEVFSSFEEAEAADRAYWHSRTPAERVLHMLYLRRINYGTRATERLQRVLEVVARPLR